MNINSQIKPVESIIRSTININLIKGQEEYINIIRTVKGGVILYNNEGNKWNYQEKQLLGAS